MIARDNETRERLNGAARVRLRQRGELSGPTFRVQDRSWTVGDRIITRRNDRRLDVDNGTLGTITAYDRSRMAVRIRTDNGEHRWLNLHYLAHHVELAYAITGHSGQGATVDRALVVGRPEAFTRAYTALSRARTRHQDPPHRRPRTRRTRPPRICAGSAGSRTLGLPPRSRARHAEVQ
jgi:ATP-dependent exoDNAse (exonuclease V) alpha subunit